MPHFSFAFKKETIVTVWKLGKPEHCGLFILSLVFSVARCGRFVLSG